MTVPAPMIGFGAELRGRMEDGVGRDAGVSQMVGAGIGLIGVGYRRAVVEEVVDAVAVGVDRAAGVVVASRENPVARAVLVEAVPRHNRVPLGIESDGGGALVGRRELVDLELGAETPATAIESLAEDTTFVTVLLQAPDHQRASIGSDGDVGFWLVRRPSVGVDLEVVTQRGAGGVEASSDDIDHEPILLPGPPGHENEPSRASATAG